MIRSEKTKQAFIDYLEEHPDERFWQAVRNFSGYPFILASEQPPADLPYQLDTFHWEELHRETARERFHTISYNPRRNADLNIKDEVQMSKKAWVALMLFAATCGFVLGAIWL